MSESLNDLVQQLQSDQLTVQIAAAETLAGLAEAAQPAIVALVSQCGSENEDLCNWCTSALEEVGAPTAEQIEALIGQLESENINEAFWAATLLGRAGAMAEPATSVLAKRSADASAPEVQKRAAWALDRIQAV